jgi:hypothetical protein
MSELRGAPSATTHKNARGDRGPGNLPGHFLDLSYINAIVAHPEEKQHPDVSTSAFPLSVLRLLTVT